MTKDSKRVLIVDDEEMIRNVVVRILKMKNHESVEAENGEIALQKIKTLEPFDYAILDLSMPGSLSGEEVFNHLRENYPETDVIISTGFIDQRKKEDFLSRGAKAILEKPYKIDQVLELLE